MHNLSIQFAYPWSGWLLFLLIPGIALPLILHFRSAKKYRRTRNKIISLVLHIVVVVLTVAALSGMVFVYEVDNPENQLILLVDVSDTEEEAQARRDAFVQEVLEEGGGDIKTGVVTFGFTQEYAVPLTLDTEGLYDRYKSAELPDRSATNISAALKYAASLFDGTDSAKIVLVTDGKETDEKASAAIATIAAMGIEVDTVSISSDYEEEISQVVGVEFPEYHISAGEKIGITVSIRSKKATAGNTVELYDNDKLDPSSGKQEVDLPEGIHTVTFSHTFETGGLHKIVVQLRRSGDSMEQNDRYCSYIYLDTFNKVLILEGFEGQSEKLDAVLSQEETGYETTVMNIAEDGIPTTAEQLRDYDQVILNNISNADLQLHEGLDRALYSYVYEYGGGLFTVGGSEAEVGADGEYAAHAYNRADMSGSLFQQMLPVQAIDYTPPVGVVIIIDISGSMDMSYGNRGETKRELAKQGAINCLQALTERDWVGIMTTDTVYSVVLPMTRCTEQPKIESAIQGIDGKGGTVFADAIQRAGQMLTDLKSVDRRHVIIVTDGNPTDGDTSYVNEAQENARNGITLSVVAIGVSEGTGSYNKMNNLVEAGGGRLHLVGTTFGDIANEMYEDLNVDEIKEMNDEPFYPLVSDPLSPLLNGVSYGEDPENKMALPVQLGGFYGVKVRADEYLVLQGEYEVPIYAQWKFGAGSVGSFMSDLNGRWSQEFIDNQNGRQFLLNVVGNLMPTSNIRASEFTFGVKTDNYINTLSVDAKLQDGESIRGEIFLDGDETGISLNELSASEEAECYVTQCLSAENGYSRCDFIVKRSGTYKIVLQKVNAAGEIVETLETYHSFSFSKEYDIFAEEEFETSTADMLRVLAENGNGKVIAPDRSWEVFDGFADRLVRTFDPRYLFMITAMALFLLDIAVRKFRFKWIHEIVKERKMRKAAQKK